MFIAHAVLLPCASVNVSVMHIAIASLRVCSIARGDDGQPNQSFNGTRNERVCYLSRCVRAR